MAYISPACPPPTSRRYIWTGHGQAGGKTERWGEHQTAMQHGRCTTSSEKSINSFFVLPDYCSFHRNQPPRELESDMCNTTSILSAELLAPNSKVSREVTYDDKVCTNARKSRTKLNKTPCAIAFIRKMRRVNSPADGSTRPGLHTQNYLPVRTTRTTGTPAGLRSHYSCSRQFNTHTHM